MAGRIRSRWSGSGYGFRLQRRSGSEMSNHTASRGIYVNHKKD